MKELIQKLAQVGPVSFLIDGKPITLEAKRGELWVTGNPVVGSHITALEFLAMVEAKRAKPNIAGFFRVEGTWFIQPGSLEGLRGSKAAE